MSLSNWESAPERSKAIEWIMAPVMIDFAIESVRPQWQCYFLAFYLGAAPLFYHFLNLLIKCSASVNQKGFLHFYYPILNCNLFFNLKVSPFGEHSEESVSKLMGQPLLVGLHLDVIREDQHPLLVAMHHHRQHIQPCYVLALVMHCHLCGNATSLVHLSTSHQAAINRPYYCSFRFTALTKVIYQQEDFAALKTLISL